MKVLLELLTEYKGLSQQIINDLQKDSFDKIDSYIEAKQKIIEKIEEVEYTQEQFVKISNEISLENIENTLQETLSEKFNLAKSQVNKMKLNKSINSSYNRIAPVDSIFLNKKF